MVFYILFFGVLFLWYKKYKSPVLNFVLLFYLAASICGVFTHYYIEPNAYCTFLSVLFQCIVFFLFIYPIIVYGRSEQTRAFILMDDKRFKVLAYVLIVLQFFTIVFFAGFDIALLSRGDFAQIRAEMFFDDLDIGASLGRTIAGVASYYYCFNILLFFYSLAFRKDPKWFLVLLIFTSSSRIFHALTYMGRDGILFWILSFAFSYFLFKPYIDGKNRKVVRQAALIIGGFAVVIIGAITISRFGESDSGSLMSVVSYFGEPINNFGQLFDKFHEYRGTRSIFPLLYGSRGGSGISSMEMADNFYLKYGFYNNIFFSFVGNLHKAYGPFLTLFLSVLYGLLMSNRVNRRVTSLSTLIVLMFASIIVLQNYFYWAYSIRVGNLFVFTVPLFVIYCNKNNNCVVTKKTESDEKS